MHRDPSGFAMQTVINLGTLLSPTSSAGTSFTLTPLKTANTAENIVTTAVPIIDGANVPKVVGLDTPLAQELTALGGKGSIPIEPGSPMSKFGSHLGESSGRPFFPNEIGLPIPQRQLSTDNVLITNRGVDKVEQHLSRFGSDPQNQAQLERLRDIANGRIFPTQADLNNYTHELRESLRYNQFGFKNGVPSNPEEAYKLWNNAHTATLEDYGLKEGFGVLYHPSTYQQ
jgi:hypothetical protein